MKVVIAGGSGTLGRRVAADLTQAGHTIVILTRRRRANLAYPQVEWDGRSISDWAPQLGGAARAYSPAVWLQASTLAIYGDAGDEVLDESSPVAEGPPQMAGVAIAWEQAASAAPVNRQVVLRTDPALGLTGRRAVPRRLLDAGFAFSYPTLRPALEDLVS